MLDLRRYSSKLYGAGLVSLVQAEFERYERRKSVISLTLYGLVQESVNFFEIFLEMEARS